MDDHEIDAHVKRMNRVVRFSAWTVVSTGSTMTLALTMTQQGGLAVTTFGLLTAFVMGLPRLVRPSQPVEQARKKDRALIRDAKNLTPRKPRQSAPQDD